MQIIDTDTGRALEYNGETLALPALAADATVHVYDTPDGPWLGIQEAGKPRPVYAGAGGKYVGKMALEADEEARIAAQIEAKRRGMVVSKAQAHIALHNAGLYQQVVDMMNDPDTDPVAVIAWQTASEYSRLSPNLLAVKDGLGLTDEQLDDLFEQAAQITP